MYRHLRKALRAAAAGLYRFTHASLSCQRTPVSVRSVRQQAARLLANHTHCATRNASHKSDFIVQWTHISSVIVFVLLVSYNFGPIS